MLLGLQVSLEIWVNRIVTSSFTHMLGLESLGWRISGGQLVASPCFLLTLLTFLLFFADPRPRPTLEDIEVYHMMIFNSLSEE